MHANRLECSDANASVPATRCMCCVYACVSVREWVRYTNVNWISQIVAQSATAMDNHFLFSHQFLHWNYFNLAVTQSHTHTHTTWTSVPVLVHFVFTLRSICSCKHMVHRYINISTHQRLTNQRNPTHYSFTVRSEWKERNRAREEENLMNWRRSLIACGPINACHVLVCFSFLRLVIYIQNLRRRIRSVNWILQWNEFRTKKLKCCGRCCHPKNRIAYIRCRSQ